MGPGRFYGDPISARSGTRLMMRPDHELLLAACLLPERRAVSAYRAWRSAINFERLDPASFRILPFLARNLGEGRLDPEDRPLIRGVTRKTWYKNRLLFHALGQVLARFHERGIPTLLLKGTALIPFVYGDFGVRSQGDADLLIPPDRVGEAAEILRNSGWRVVPDKRALLAPEARTVHRACPWADGRGNEIDLHWHAVTAGPHAGSDEDFWEGGTSVSLLGAPTRIMGPSDLLFHVCFHGIRGLYLREAVSPLHWVIDAREILAGTGGEVDFERLDRLARGRGCRLLLTEALDYLAECFQAPVPRSFFATAPDPPPRFEVREARFLRRRCRPLGRWPVNWFDFLRWERGRDSGCRPAALRRFAEYLRRLYGLSGVSRLPFYALRRLGRKLAGRSAGRAS